MSTKQYVRHVSGQGEKWEVTCDNGLQWGSKETQGRMGHYWLPKSEYALCEPPEKWTDVTEQIGGEHKDGPFTRWDHLGEWGCVLTVAGNSPYRLRKVQIHELTQDSFSYKTWCFIVERKTS